MCELDAEKEGVKQRLENMEIKEEIELVSKIKNAANSKGGVLLNAYISGSHLYGWNSKDSDMDIRGCYVLRKEKFLGLSTPKDFFEIKDVAGQDMSFFEIKKLAGLAITGNCNILEEFSAKQIYKTADFLKFQQLVNNAFGKKGLYNSYKGLATYNYKKFVLQGKNTVKKYLYVLRGLMAGIYVLQTGQMQPNVEELNKRFKISEVAKLLEIKRNGLEQEPLRDVETSKLDELITGLFTDLDAAYLKSRIPETPEDEEVAEIDKFIIDLRLGLRDY